MFELTIEREFCAAHAITIRGKREPVHGHNWHITIAVTGERLDDEGLLCDFHQLESVLDEIIRPFQNRNLNESPPFDTVNPTAERVAEYIAEAIRPKLPAAISLAWVRVTEAPGCAAMYRPDQGES